MNISGLRSIGNVDWMKENENQSNKKVWSMKKVNMKTLTSAETRIPKLDQHVGKSLNNPRSMQSVLGSDDLNIIYWQITEELVREKHTVLEKKEIRICFVHLYINKNKDCTELLVSET